MYTRTVLIVSDKFARFAEGKDAMTVSQLRAMLHHASPPLSCDGSIALVPGQGFSEAAERQLLEEASLSPHYRHFDFSLWRDRPKRAESSLSHKLNPENTLISTPKCLAEDCYHMHLLVDENCELMSDHQSGQHVQGMVLLEAARQSLLVVTEAFFLPRNDAKFAFVFNKMAVNYSHFAFPFDADLIYEIKEKNIKKKTRMSFAVDIRIEQCGVIAASFEAEFSAFKNELISGKEQAQADQALEAILARARAQQPRTGLIVGA